MGPDHPSSVVPEEAVSNAPSNARGPHLRALAIVVVGVCLDQVTKGWAEATLADRPFVELVPGLVELRFSRNAGLGFGLGQGIAPAYRAGLLSVVMGAGLVALGLVYLRTRGQCRVQLGVAMLFAGGASNLVDRLRRGDVIDFIHLRLGQWFQLGTFNPADVAIFVGLCWLSYLTLWPDRMSRAERGGMG